MRRVNQQLKDTAAKTVKGIRLNEAGALISEGAVKGQPRSKRHQKARAAAKNRIVTPETGEIMTQPRVELRRPATLAQTLTEPVVAVVIHRNIRRIA